MYTIVLLVWTCFNLASCLRYDMRITGGPDPRMGRVEILYKGQWGSICADSVFNNNAAKVICRHLGLSGGRAISASSFPSPPQKVWVSNLMCSSAESYLDECGYDGFTGDISCSRGEAGVSCGREAESSESRRERSTDIRLQGGPTDLEGRIEIFHQGQWGTICADSEFDESAAAVVCRKLGLSGGAVKLACSQTYGRGPDLVWLTSLDCTSFEKTVDECRHDAWGSVRCFRGDAAVSCAPSTLNQHANQDYTYEMRLMGGPSSHEGRVELLYDGQWGTICADSGFDSAAATVICRQLGLSGGDVVPTRSFGHAPDKVWLSNIRCSSRENYLDECTNDGWGRTNAHNRCYNEDAGVKCRPRY